MPTHVETAQRVLAANVAVQFGIFGIIDGSGYFPPREFLNEFLKAGSDPCDQDRQMGRWTSFELSPNEYNEVAEWWIANTPGTVVADLGVTCWSDWVQVILHPEDWGYPEGLPYPGDPTVRAYSSD